MRKRQGFQLRSVANEQVIVATGADNIDFSSIISLNESAAFLWNNIEKSDFTADTLTELLVNEYNIDQTTAHNDAVDLIEQWHKAGIIQI